MRFSHTLWPWASLAVVALAILLMRIVSPHHAKPSAPRSISDLSISSPLNQPGGGAVTGEAYEIYSALYQLSQPEPLAFAEDSVTDIPQVDGSCLRPSTPQEHEMVDAFVAANKQSHRWERRFSIPAEYRLLSHDESETALSCIELRKQDTASCEPYKQLLHVRYLGVPGFDRAHTRALVSIVKKCGAYCGSGGIFVVDKTGNSWQREATEFARGCSWMY
jgi:hypothetical protein